MITKKTRSTAKPWSKKAFHDGDKTLNRLVIRNGITKRELPNILTKPTTERMPFRILIAEDDVLLNKVLSLLLDHHGYSVESAPDGKAALSLLEKDMTAFDLLITDHEMPNLNGLGLVRHLRAANYPGKIIVFASPPDAEAQAAYRKLSISRLLFKPLENQVLVDAVGEVL